MPVLAPFLMRQLQLWCMCPGMLPYIQHAAGMLELHDQSALSCAPKSVQCWQHRLNDSTPASDGMHGFYPMPIA